MKRFLSLCLVLVMSLGLTTPVFAVDDCSGDEGIMPYAMPCPDCGQNLSNTVRWYEETEVRTRTRKCTHGRPIGEDAYYEMSGFRIVKCTQCTFGYTEKATKGEWRCFGHY